MGKVFCTDHLIKNRKPVMIHFGKNSLGEQYVCAVCSAVKQFNSGRIVSLNPEKQFGFINGVKGNIFFHFSNLSSDFSLQKGMILSYEIQFLEGDEIQAINITPANGGKNGN